VVQQTDVELPGVLALVLTRTHVSSYRVGRWYGPSWASTLDQRLEVDPTGVCYAGADGTLLVYPTPTVDGPVVPEDGPRLPRSRTEDGGYQLDNPDQGQTLHFRPTGLEGGEVVPLAAITDRNHNRIDLDYDADGTLTAVRHSGGYHIAVVTSGGRITALRLIGAEADRRAPDADGQVLVRYGYDTAGLLHEVASGPTPTTTVGISPRSATPAATPTGSRQIPPVRLALALGWGGPGWCRQRQGWSTGCAAARRA
jgi:YD repeat-containing protein